MKELIENGKEYYKKYREGITYLIFGGIATFLNIGVFALFTDVFKFNYEISNIIAIVVAIIFQYISNKFVVFESKKSTLKDNLKEFISFISCRLITMLLDQALMIIGVGKLGFDKLIMKVVVNIIVIIVNYIFSKLIVFRKKN